MRPEEINRNVNLAFKRFFRYGTLFHFAKCKRHLEKLMLFHLHIPMVMRGHTLNTFQTDGTLLPA